MTFLSYEIQQDTLPVKMFSTKANLCRLFAQTYFFTATSHHHENRVKTKVSLLKPTDALFVIMVMLK
jgi:hypothetical protein